MEWNFSDYVIREAREIEVGDRVAIHWVEAEAPDQEGTIVGVNIERYGHVYYTAHIDGDSSPTDGFTHDPAGNAAGSVRLISKAQGDE